VFVLTALIAPAAGCIYHKPEFYGQILDKETNQPIEGAVVVAVYNKQAMGFGAGANTEIINVREALTNSNGKFHIPSYTTLITPIFTRESSATFVIFKPGYASLSGMDLEDHFSNKEGSEGELPLPYNRTQSIRFAPKGIVELPKLETKEQRKHAWMVADIFGAEIKTSDLPILYRIIGEGREIGF
jgi:hypothetical protein